jgi:hypothetical protein
MWQGRRAARADGEPEGDAVPESDARARAPHAEPA